MIVVSFFNCHAGLGRYFEMERMGREEILAMYKPDVERLVYYLPWLEGKSGRDVSDIYYADKAHATLPFPVYDEILLTFLNELSSTVFMDQNYRYLYTRYHIHDYHDELAMIAKTDIMSMDILNGILSKYMLGGMTKANLWIEGIEHQIFWKAVQKAKEIVEFWDVPLDVPMMELDGEESEEELPVEMPEAEETVASEEIPEAAIMPEELPDVDEAAATKELPEEQTEELPDADEAAATEEVPEEQTETMPEMEKSDGQEALPTEVTDSAETVAEETIAPVTEETAEEEIEAPVTEEI